MKKLALAVLLSLLALLLLGCGSSATEQADAPPEEPAASDEFPVFDASGPLTAGEKGTVTLGTPEQVDLIVQSADGAPLYELPIKPNTVIDPNTAFTIHVIEPELPEDLAATYVAVGSSALELHAVQETGYGFALKPLLTIHYTQADLDAAQAAGANLEPLKGNLIVLYKEQRSPKWVPQTSVTVNEAENTVVISNIAGSGAWRLAAKKAQ
jgi:hypothetical protein